MLKKMIEAALDGLMSNRKQITRTIGNIVVRVIRAMADSYLQDRQDAKKSYSDI